jgi:hypothetical protein
MRILSASHRLRLVVLIAVTGCVVAISGYARAATVIATDPTLASTPGIFSALSDDGATAMVVIIKRRPSTDGSLGLNTSVDVNLVNTATARRRRLGTLAENALPSFDPSTSNVLYRTPDQLVLQRGTDGEILRRWNGFDGLAIGSGSHFAFVQRHNRRGARPALSALGILNLRTSRFAALPPSHTRALSHAGLVRSARVSDDGRFVAFLYVHGVDWRFWVVVDRVRRTYRFFPDTDMLLSMSRNGQVIAVGMDHGDAYSIYNPITQLGFAIPSYSSGNAQGGTLNATGTILTTACGLPRKSTHLFVHSLSTGAWGTLPEANVRWSLAAGNGNSALFVKDGGALRWTSLAAAQQLGTDPPVDCVNPAEAALPGAASGWFTTQNVLGGRPDCEPPRGSSGQCDPQVPR